MFQFVLSHRILVYSTLSYLAVCAVVSNALQLHSNFYSIAIHLSNSSRSLLVLANWGILLSLFQAHILQRIFFGALRPNEIERLYDRLWFFITESLLAFTIFRDEFDTPFALMFGFLLFVKSFHWLASDRIEWMDQRPYPGPPLTFHIRMILLFSLLWATDLVVFLFAVEHTLSTGVGGMVLFASEYGILVASLMNTILKYLLSSYDFRRAGSRGGENAPPWENKSMWIFYIELATDFLKLSTYLVFFIVIIAFYGLPLNIIRDVYITARSFITRLKALHRYQTATRNMDQRYPNATEEELTRMNDRTCIICREEMVPTVAQEPNTQSDGPNMTPKKLPCGHIFHFQCLRSWLERQQSCPTCRRNVLDENNETRAPVAGAAVDQRRDAAGNPQQNPLPQPVARGANPPVRNNNPMGLLGRFFRAPHGNNAPRFNNGQQPGIFINYQVQYQLPRRRNENRDGQLQPPPPFVGFPGPGGAWHPWPTGDATVPHSTTTPSETQRETPTTDTQSPLESLNISESVDDNIPLAREGARQAALRRHEQDIGGRPDASTSGTIPHQPTTTASKSNDTGPPQLIPIFEFRDSVGDSSVAVTHVASWEDEHSTPPISVTSTMGPESNTTTTTTTSPRSPRRITDDQLEILDNLTRESIDLRLRILDGISATLNECIDDLVELRSALPLDREGSSPISTESTEQDSTEHKGKGKEKAPEASVPSGEMTEELHEGIDY